MQGIYDCFDKVWNISIMEYGRSDYRECNGERSLPFKATLVKRIRKIVPTYYGRGLGCPQQAERVRLAHEA